MTMNGHFAGVGDAPTKEQYEHGIQVIDEEKEFKQLRYEIDLRVLRRLFFWSSAIAAASFLWHLS